MATYIIICAAFFALDQPTFYVRYICTFPVSFLLVLLVPPTTTLFDLIFREYFSASGHTQVLFKANFNLTISSELHILYVKM